MTTEPTITINGHVITDAMTMTLRVALEAFAYDLSTDGLGKDEHGTKMKALYMKRISELRDLLYTKENPVSLDS